MTYPTAGPLYKLLGKILTKDDIDQLRLGETTKAFALLEDAFPRQRLQAMHLTPGIKKVEPPL
jgi:hypothetical protein